MQFSSGLLDIMDQQILQQSDGYYDALLNRVNALDMEKFLRKNLPLLAKEQEARELGQLQAKAKAQGKPVPTSIYPKKILLPKSIPEMLEGDFSPSKVIELKEPIQSSFGPIWFGSSLKGCNLRAGYFDGDSSRITNFALSDDTVHLALAGSSGQGKSVSLDIMVLMLMMEYAPWEVRILQCDAKVLGAKKYGDRLATKHIEAVGATGDADYMISLLDYYTKEMTLLSSVFAKAGVRNIEDFRKVTGLSFPRHVLVYDEIQTGMQEAKGKASKVADAVDKLARQGRSSGYHLILASQEVVSELSAAMKNVTMRAAMGCFEDVSINILGNDAAKYNMGKKGRMVFTDNTEDKTKKSNRMVRVPYASDTLINKIGDELRTIGNNFKVEYPMSFFDAQEKMRFRGGNVNYKDWLREREVSALTWRLGESAFVSSDLTQSTKMEFTGDCTENVCFFASNFMGLKRLYQMARTYAELQVEQQCGATHVVSVCDKRFNREELNPTSFCPPNLVFSEGNFEKASGLQLMLRQIYLRKLLTSIEYQLEGGLSTSEERDEEFYARFKRGSEFDTLRNRSRFYYAYNFILSNEDGFTDLFSYSGLLDLTSTPIPVMEEIPEIEDGVEGEELQAKQKEREIAVAEAKEKYEAALHKYRMTSPVIEIACDVVRQATKCGCSSCAVTNKHFSPLYCWLLGLDTMLGIGRKTRTPFINLVLDSLMMSSENNVRFFIFVTQFDPLTDLLPGIGIVVSDSINSRQMSKFKVDNFPEMGSDADLDVLTILSVHSEPVHYKFKKVFFEGEY